MATERLPAAQRRDQLLDAANDLFGRLGYEATRMDDVAEAAGVAKGLLYKHFDSKDALFEALLEREGQEFADRLRQALLQSDVAAGPVAALQTGLDVWLGELKQGVPPFFFTDPGAHPAYDQMRERIRTVIADVIVLFAPETPPGIARLIAAAVQGAAETVGLAWQTDPAGLTYEEAVGMISEFCWGGLSLLQESAAAAEVSPAATRR